MSEELVAKSSITIASPGKDVWKALLDPRAIEKYMFGTQVASTWMVGSPITWSGEWEGKRYEDRGVILENEPEKKLAYSHYSAMSGSADVPANHHTVTIWLESDGVTTHVDLHQDGNASAPAREKAQTNWAAMLTGLRGYVEGLSAKRRLGSAAS
jgi:uncharacterized protein YndB with AHSA1/START domain